MRNRKFRCWLAGVFSLGLFSMASFAATYTIGVVPQTNARALHDTWNPILEVLQKRTGHTFTLRGSASIPIFEQEFDAGAFDFAYMNPYHYLKAHTSQGYVPLVRDTKEPLVGILVVRKDSSYKDVTQLQGKTLAFPSPNALGASLLMRAQLKRKFDVDFTPIYVKSHDSVYLNVVLGGAAAGGGVLKTLQQQPAEVREQLRVLYTTPGMAPHPLAAHSRVPAALREQVRQVLLEMGQNEKGRALLAKAGFGTIGLARDADYQPLKELGLEAFWVNE